MEQGWCPLSGKWTPRMSEPSNPLILEIVGVLRNGRRRYDPASKRRLVEACLQPGSVSSRAVEFGEFSLSTPALRLLPGQRGQSRLSAYTTSAALRREHV